MPSSNPLSLLPPLYDIAVWQFILMSSYKAISGRESPCNTHIKFTWKMHKVVANFSCKPLEVRAFDHLQSQLLGKEVKLGTGNWEVGQIATTSVGIPILLGTMQLTLKTSCWPYHGLITSHNHNIHISFNIICLWEKYGQTVVTRVNQLANIRVCIAKYCCHLYFNHCGKENYVLPVSFKFWPPLRSAKGYKLMVSTGFSFFKLWIHECHSSILRLCALFSHSLSELSALLNNSETSWVRMFSMCL